MEEIKAKVVLIGNSSVGKTSISMYYRDQKSEMTKSPTVGAVMMNFTKEINGKKVTLNLYDTAGQERYRSIGPVYYRDSVGALAVFDVNDIDSFKALSKWIATFKESTEDAFIIIVANKCDLPSPWNVSMEMAENFADSNNLDLFYTSANTGDEINNLFDKVFENVSLIGVKQEEKMIPKDDKDKKCC